MALKVNDAVFAVKAYDAVTGTFDAYDAVNAYDEELATKAYDAVSGTFDAYDAVNEYDAEVAFKIEPDQYEADCACVTYDAVCAKVTNDAVATDIDDVWFVRITFDPFTVNDPVIKTEPVNSCVFVSKLPLRVEPVTKSIDEVIVCATIVWAVNVPPTVKLSA